MVGTPTPIIIGRAITKITTARKKDLWVRWITSIVLIQLCLFAMITGHHFVQFAIARGESGSTDAIQPSIGVAGVNGPALALKLASTGAEHTREQQVSDLTALLEARPLSSTQWLSLATANLENGGSPAETDRALTMSYLTGPHEGPLLWRRAVFGLLHWEDFNSDLHQDIIEDLGGAVADHLASGEDITLAAHFIAQMPKETRDAIAKGLRDTGIGPAEFARLGLPDSR
jgi:hypothetical protein